MTEVTLERLRAEVEEIILEYEGRRIDLEQEKENLSRGKLYEFYVLGRTLEELRWRGYQIRLHGAILDLKQSPSAIKPGDTHFVATSPNGVQLSIYTDVEVTTLGSELSSTSGLCSYHEIDIVVVEYGAVGRPSFRQVALGVECKSHGKFTKSILKEVLGVKREISLLHSPPQISILAQLTGATSPTVNSDPPLEYWLAHADPNGLKYAQSPGVFGIEFKYWRP